MPQSCARKPQGLAAPKLPGAPAAQLSKIAATTAGRSQHCMGVLGVEPRTSSLSGTRSNQTELYARGRSRPHRSAHAGGAEGIRTLDIQLAKLALSPTELQPRPANIRPRGASGPSRPGWPGGHRPLNSTTCLEPLVPAPSRRHRHLGPLQHHGPKAAAWMLLRKEVIQPLVPQRLPCYDFIPVTSHTFGAFYLAVRTATSGATSSHDVTGGVYKARERIQGVVADTPLLAIPASCRRIAACNLNWGRFSGLATPRGVAPHCAGHCSTCAALGVRAMRT